jgi:hypothetical protein
MQLWILYAISASILIGINNVLIKIIAERDMDVHAFLLAQALVFMV